MEPEKKQNQEKEKYEERYYGGPFSGLNIGGLIIGLFFIFVGVIYFIDNVSREDFWISFEWSYLWPLGAILAGLIILHKKGWFSFAGGAVFVLIALGLLFVVIFGVGSDALWGGSRDIVVEEKELGNNIKTVAMLGKGDLFVDQGLKNKLVIEADRNFIEAVKIREEKGKLEIDCREDWLKQFFLVNKEINFYLTLEDIEKIEIIGDGKVIVDRIEADNLLIQAIGDGKASLGLEVNNLEISMEKEGNFYVFGWTDFQRINIDGSGKYDGVQTLNNHTLVEIVGKGEAEIRTREKLQADVSGRGRIFYWGNPQIDQNVFGGGKIERLGD